MKSMCERIEIRKNTFNDTQIKTLGKSITYTIKEYCSFIYRVEGYSKSEMFLDTNTIIYT